MQRNESSRWNILEPYRMHANYRNYTNQLEVNIYITTFSSNESCYSYLTSARTQSNLYFNLLVSSDEEVRQNQCTFRNDPQQRRPDWYHRY